MNEELKSELTGIKGQVKNFCEAERGRREELSEKQMELQARVLEIEQKGNRSKGDGFVYGMSGPSAGDQFADGIEKHRESLTRTKSYRQEGLAFNAAATDLVTTSSGRRIVSDGVGAPGVQPIGLQFATPQRTAEGITATEYSRFIGV